MAPLTFVHILIVIYAQKEGDAINEKFEMIMMLGGEVWFCILFPILKYQNRPWYTADKMWILKPAVNWCSKFKRCGKTQTHRQKIKNCRCRCTDAYLYNGKLIKKTYICNRCFVRKNHRRYWSVNKEDLIVLGCLCLTLINICWN